MNIKRKTNGHHIYRCVYCKKTFDTKYKLVEHDRRCLLKEAMQDKWNRAIKFHLQAC